MCRGSDFNRKVATFLNIPCFIIYYKWDHDVQNEHPAILKKTRNLWLKIVYWGNNLSEKQTHFLISFHVIWLLFFLQPVTLQTAGS